ncbi:MAG: hypothetical protein F8N37_16125 [Telmatospirillum sp.]|nr:hypothetical protein [Telmatospirillum sp.]
MNAIATPPVDPNATDTLGCLLGCLWEETMSLLLVCETQREKYRQAAAGTNSLQVSRALLGTAMRLNDLTGWLAAQRDAAARGTSSPARLRHRAMLDQPVAAPLPDDVLALVNRSLDLYTLAVDLEDLLTGPSHHLNG